MSGKERVGGPAVGRRVRSYLDDHMAGYVEMLRVLASCPSVSATGEGVTECAGVLVALMDSLGVPGEIHETGGSPLVRGTLGAGDYTLVVYGHYDVQPPVASQGWRHPPFEPFLERGAMYGCGVGDNKGQLLSHLIAAAALQEVSGTPLPFRIIFAFDGEEEVGSPNTSRFVREHPELFKGDFCYTADASTLEVSQPGIMLGIRGLLYLELLAPGAVSEWHSGSYGGLLPNPVRRLADALSSLFADGGELAVAGFYDDVRDWSREELGLADALPASFLSDPGAFGVSAFASANPRREMFFRPQVCICGFHGGYTGRGMKTAVPTRARALLDFTLVPNQRAETVLDLVRRHLADHGWGDIEVSALAKCDPIFVDAHHPFVEMVRRSMREVWKVAPVIFPSIGGGGPLATFADACAMDCLLVPYAQADLHEHSADEHLSLEWFGNGIKVSAELFRLLSERSA
jgi:acetylornithine deacetylase/succinyl-diaminopimelate desuccinylase-like protein